MKRWRSGALIVGRLLRAGAALTCLAVLLAGVPWLLWHLAGWPLPTHVPSGADVVTVLGRPVGSDVIGAVLACVAWLAWAAFTLELLLGAYTAAGQIRLGTYATGSAHPRPLGSGASPHRSGGIAGMNPGVPGNRATARLAATLLSAVILSIVSVRPAPPLPLSASPVVAVTALPIPGAPTTTGTTGITGGSRTHPSHDYAHPEPSTGVRRVVVRPPHGRVHDTLWLIAERELGTHRHWHDIYTLNVGRLQPDGRRLDNPDRIYPGWILDLPTISTHPESTPPQPAPHDATAATPSGHERKRAPTPTPTPTPTPISTPSGTHLPGPTTSVPPVVRATQASPAHTGLSRPDLGHTQTERSGAATPVGIGLPSGGFVGVGMAAAVSATLAMAIARRRRRGLREGQTAFRLPLDPIPNQAPPRVVQILQRAHLAATTTRDPDDIEQTPDPDHGDDPDHGGDPDHGDGPDPVVDGPAGEVVPGGGTVHVPVESSPALRAATHAVAPLPPPTWSDPLAHPATSVGRPPERGPLPIGLQGREQIMMDVVGGAALGLTGDGAHGVARAVILALLTRVRRPRSAPSLTMVMPYHDAVALFGPVVANDPPPLITVVSDLGHALDRLEVDTLARRRQHLQQPDAETPAEQPASAHGHPGHAGHPSHRGPQMPTLILVATPDGPARARLEAILTLGCDVAVAAITLGPWPGGLSYDVSGDGNLTDHSGTRLFTFTKSDAEDVVEVIRDAFGPTVGHNGRHRDNPPDPGEGHNAHSSGWSPVNIPEGGNAGAIRGGRGPSSPASTVITAPPTGAALLATPVGQPLSRSVGVGEPATLGRQLGAGDGTGVRLDSTATPQPSPHPAPVALASTVGVVLKEWKDTAPPGSWSAPVTVHILGQLRVLTAGAEVRHGLRGKTRELLLFLLLNPAGVSVEAVAEALWPEQREGTSSLRSTMKRLRAQLRSVTGMPDQGFIVYSSGRYRPDRRLLACDAWQFEAATRRASDVPAAAPVAAAEDNAVVGADAGRRQALREAVALYAGTLLDGFDYLWLEPYRQALRHHALNVFVRYAAAVADADPESALAALERALPIDPVNEALYRRVMRLQAALHRPEAITGTLTLLQRNLADIDERPERQTLALAAALRSTDPSGVP